MIVVAHPSGRSFKWLAEYLQHDVKAQTSERLAWTHTLNCAHDDIASAVHEMLHTYLDRDLLRARAGVRPGGATIEKPVKHVSLSWDPSEKVSREEMIAAAQSYLEALGWGHHQCALFAHSDKAHQHVHLMINMVEPDRGTRLKDHREWRKAQAWAYNYEKSRGRIFCEERSKPIHEREASPPRNVWEHLRVLQEAAPSPEPKGKPLQAINYDAPVKEWQQQEWLALKAKQKAERVVFFENGRIVYKSLRQDVYRQVRANYRHEWANYYRIMKHGAAPQRLAALRTGLIARQSKSLQAECREAAVSLRAERDAFYKDLLRQQRDLRTELTERQSQGVGSPQLLNSPERIPAPGEERTIMPSSPIAGQSWSQRGGLVPQQRSARRWLDYARDRINRRFSKHGPTRANALQRERERLLSGEQRRRGRSDKGIEPGGSGPEL